jgi:hypothetical protein
MLVTVIINSMGSAVGPKINVIAMPSGIIPTGPDDASCVDPGYFSVSRVYDVPNDTTSIIIRSVEYNCSTPGVCDDYEMSIIPAYDTTTSTSSTSTSTTSTSSTSTSSTSTSTTSTSSTSTSTTSTSSTSTSTTSTSTSSSTTTTSTTEEPGDGTCYNLDIPEDKLTLGEEDLYIAYTLPGETLAEVLITNIPSTDEHPGYYTINICSMTVPLYSYGEPHNHVSIPEIIVTVSGSCNEDNECTSPTTTTSTSSTTTTTSTTVLLGNCYDIVVPEAYFTQGGYTLWISYYPYGGGDVVYQAYTAYDDEGDMSPDVHIKLCALSTPNEPLFWYNDIAYDHDDWIIAQCDNMCDEHTDCVNCTTTTTTTGEPTTTTTTTEPPLCYHIEIPDDKLTYLGADLYINRQLPGGSSEEIVYFNIPETEERVDYYVINICSIFEPLFSYGSPYNHVSIPEIEITINGTCDEDTDCVSPTTTSTSSTTTTSTTICPLYEVYLQIADTANDACVAPSVQYWMDTVVFGIGSEIYSDCGTTLITNTYAVKVDTQRIYTVSAGVIATDTGDDCV